MITIPEMLSRNARMYPDDCALVERLGVKPVWIPGPRTNLKVTTQEDMRVIQALM